MAKLKLKKATKVAETIEEVRPHVVKHLEDTVDKTRPFAMYYSGVETRRYFDVMYNMGVRNFLMSYHYIQNRHLSMQQTYGGLGVKFFIAANMASFCALRYICCASQTALPSFKTLMIFWGL